MTDESRKEIEEIIASHREKIARWDEIYRVDPVRAYLLDLCKVIAEPDPEDEEKDGVQIYRVDGPLATRLSDAPVWLTKELYLEIEERLLFRESDAGYDILFRTKDRLFVGLAFQEGSTLGCCMFYRLYFGSEEALVRAQLCE